jgi:hypothetical protein
MKMMETGNGIIKIFLCYHTIIIFGVDEKATG